MSVTTTSGSSFSISVQELGEVAGRSHQIEVVAGVDDPGDALPQQHIVLGQCNPDAPI